MDNDDKGSSSLLECPDITTVQAQLYLYTNKNCLEIVRLPNVIVSTGFIPTLESEFTMCMCNIL